MSVVDDASNVEPLWVDVILVILLGQFLVVKVVNVFGVGLVVHRIASVESAPHVDGMLLHTHLVHPLHVPIADAVELAQILAILVSPQFPFLSLFPGAVVVHFSKRRLVPTPRQNLGDSRRNWLGGAKLAVPRAFRYFALWWIETLEPGFEIRTVLIDQSQY